ncbi:ABC exporter membrane fusion protein [Oscillatoria sp. FACHB-1407]|uniref:ABC exporter membrane fusion protein n=1 Tax=Oscillatoria sp. FACHB-1407 TaxID=2692847 RepID=UPI001689EDB3|nr:ABC exporter membrane fusion protein [Oscillatoria sp. FACHB-1407]MBD2463536.1 ABC exporter membrane fusion protein [Oscillatoria sp. FACHB-1407]
MTLQQLKTLKRSTLTLIGLGIAIASGSSYYAFSQVEQEPTEPVVTAPVDEPVTALGRLEPVSEVVRVAAPTSLNNDRIAQLLVERGDRVQSNQVIAILDSHNRLQTALLQAQEQVRVTQARLAQVRAGAQSGELAAQQAEIVRLEEELQGEITTQTATIARRRSEVNVAQAEYNRYLALYQEGAIAASELDQRRLTLETAQAQLNEVQANRNRTADTLRAQINQARATLDQIAEVRPVDVQVAQSEVDQAIAAVKRAEAELEESYIRAPIAGQVLEVYTQSGEAIAEAGIVDLGTTEQMEVVAEIYQTDIGKVRTGQFAVITSEAFPGELRGTVQLLGLQVSQQEVFSNQPGENLDRRVVDVRIRLDEETSKRVASLTNLQVQVSIQP